MSENGKPVFEEAAAERELDELRRAIEETRARRRRANEAFDEFLKGFKEPHKLPEDVGLSEFPPALAPFPDAPPASPRMPAQSPLDDFAHEGFSEASSQVRPIPAAWAPSRQFPTRRAVPLIGIGVVAVLALFLWSRGGSQEEAPPPAGAVASAPEAPTPATPPAATSGTQPPPPAAEISTTGLVWMRVTVDGQRVVEREVPEGTRIPLNGSQIIIRAGDAGAVRVSIAGKDQGVFGPAGQPATRTFTVKP
jgi:hypothetical protein